MTTRELHLTGVAEADALLAEDPLALLIGMLLDQQVPMETAFAGPEKLRTRLGHLDPARIAAVPEEEFKELCATPPAVHRYPGSMAARIQQLCAEVVHSYDGDAARVWTDGDPDGREVLRRLKGLPGYGDQKARIFLALLGKQYGVDVPGWREAAGDYGKEGVRMSIADVTDAESLAEVRSYKKQVKAAARAAQS